MAYTECGVLDVTERGFDAGARGDFVLLPNFYLACEMHFCHAVHHSNGHE